MSDETTPRRVSRRTVAKGAAWAVPVVATAAAAPAASASPVTPTCTKCVQPIAGLSPTTTILGSASNATVTITPPVFGALITCSGLVSIGIATTTGARLTMSGQRGAFGSTNHTPKTYTANQLGLGVAGGALGATAVAWTGSFTFNGVTFPDGLYAGAGPVDTSPIRPTELCIDFTVPISFGVGGTNTLDCPQTVCFHPTFATATLGGVAAGIIAPAIEYATLWGA